MNRDRSNRHVDDEPLDNNDFFRRVEAGEAGSDEGWDAAADEAIDLDGLDETDDAGDELDIEFEDPDDEPTARRAATSDRSGTLAIALGGAFAAAGAVLASFGAIAPTALAGMERTLTTTGITPFGLCCVGLALAAGGALQRQATRRAADQERRIERLARSLAGAHHQRAPQDQAAFGDVERLLIAMQRQDEKINNLTRATKLYGKPLIDISNQVTEIANQVQDAQAAPTAFRGVVDEALAEASAAQVECTKQLDDRVAEALATLERMQGTIENLHADGAQRHAKAFQALHTAISGEISGIADAAARSAGSVTDAVNGSAARIDTAVGSKLDEVRGQIGESLTGLRSAADKAAKSLKSSLETTLNTATTKLSESSDAAATALRASIDQAVGELRAALASAAPAADPSGAALEGSLAAIQREVQSLATSLARLESRPLAAAPAAASPAAPAAPAAAAAAAAPKEAAPKGGDGALASRIAGERQASGKNVLGAIAKLKSMRS